jgi:photosystem II stability/assembly factor-like uncharacterized protein
LAVGARGAILLSDDGEHWNEHEISVNIYFAPIFGTSDGKRLWAVGGGANILESDDGGEHWNLRAAALNSALVLFLGPTTVCACGPSAILEGPVQ